MNVTVNPGVSIAHEDTRLLAAFYAFASAHPGDRFAITSGDRTRQPLVGVGGNVAPEGQSNHELFAYHGQPDEAIDVVQNGQYVGNAYSAFELPTFGLHTPVRSDPVHLTLLGVNG